MCGIVGIAGRHEPTWFSVETEEHRSEDDWAELLRAELLAAVKRWTVSDVPIACSLSGGLDSSTIIGLLAELGATGKP
jgi:asparagine synthase (glutamine-hydrolysing)